MSSDLISYSHDFQRNGTPLLQCVCVCVCACVRVYVRACVVISRLASCVYTL